MAAPAVREDHVQLFHLFVLFGGNCARVAAVSRVDADRIEALAHDNLWKLKANGRQRLDTDEGKETEREINRVATYVTADRLSKVFENIVSDLDGDPEFARAFCTETDVDGEKSFNTKNLKDLANGLQVLADIKYRALGDKLAAEADTSSTMKGTTNIMVNVYEALQKRFDKMPSAVETTARIVEAVKEAHNGPAAD